MALAELSEDKFVELLNRELHPSAPIQSPEHLYGREEQLESIRRELLSPGRQIFIYGDRGVGKTSLAHTAAFLHQGSGKDPILVTCEATSTFESVVRAVLRKAHGPNSAQEKSLRVAGSIGFSNVDVGLELESNERSRPEFRSQIDVNEAVRVLSDLAHTYEPRTVIVVDEFDLLKRDEDKEAFAILLKQMGDQKVPVRMILSGIGRSLDELLGKHGSAHRYIEAVLLDRLFWTPREEIIDRSAAALGLKVDSNARFRIAAISDGFPHYIHLVCKQLYWAAFTAEEVIKETTHEQYATAISQAVRSIEPHLKGRYDKAALRDKDEFQEILWAIADHSDLQRNVDAILASYQRVMKERRKDPLPRDTVVKRLNQLKGESCGKILRNYNSRRSWYEFSEPMMRGYVRLRAEDSGCPLALEYDSPRDPVRITAGVKSSLRKLPMDRPRLNRR